MSNQHKFAMIAAVGQNNEIGQNNNLVWRNKKDLARFRQMTLYNAVIMGNNTFKSLEETTLDKRMNIVLSSREYPPNNPYGLWRVTSIQEACERAERYAKSHLSSTSFFIGGATIYRQAFELVNVLYITEIHQKFNNADTFFPYYKTECWKETAREKQDGFDFVTYERK